MLEIQIAGLEPRIHLTLLLFDLRAHVPPVPARIDRAGRIAAPVFM